MSNANGKAAPGHYPHLTAGQLRGLTLLTSPFESVKFRLPDGQLLEYVEHHVVQDYTTGEDGVPKPTGPARLEIYLAPKVTE